MARYVQFARPSERAIHAVRSAGEKPIFEALTAVAGAVAGVIEPMPALGQVGSAAVYGMVAFLAVFALRFVGYFWNAPATLAQQQFLELSDSYDRTVVRAERAEAKLRTAQAEIDKLRRRTVRLEIIALRTAEQEGRQFVILDVRLVNESRDPTSFEPKWTLDANAPDGTRKARLYGRIRTQRGTQVAALQGSGQTEVEMLFEGGTNALDAHSRYIVTGSDIHGNVIRSEFPSN